MNTENVIALDATRSLVSRFSAAHSLAAWGLDIMKTGLRAGRATLQPTSGGQGPRHAAKRALPTASLLEISHDAVCVCNLDSVIEYWNSASEVLYGWNAREAVGRVGHVLLKTIFPEPLDEIEAQVMCTGQWEGELVHTLRDGRRVTVASRWTLQRDAASTPIAIMQACHDVTERERLGARCAELEARLRQAEKLESIGRCASGIAHDFNNILGAILGYGDIAQGKASAGRPIDDELDQVMQAGRRGKRLVEQILDFSRSAVAEPVAVHVQSVVEEALRLLEASLPAGVRLERTLSAGDSALWGDATQLHQVAMNLCTNAIHAMPRGGVLWAGLDRVVIAEPRMTALGVLQPGDHVRFVVSDTGTGIARAVQDRIFDPFFTTGAAKGTGLGLSLVRRIVADWHGGIELESREGCGTKFTVWLPVRGETARAPVEDVREPSHANGESVLVVDDDAALVRIAEETLAQLGYEPAGFTSGAAALEAFRAEPGRYDLVLTDESMPGLTGSQLAHEIHRIRPDLPVMLMSGHGDARTTAGVAGILYKPLVSRDIAASIARALRTRD